jgi:hypothetical protein
LTLSIALGIALAPASAAHAAAPVATGLRAADAPAPQLQPIGSEPTPGGTVVYRYQQQVGGVDVLGAEAVVADPAGGPPELVADATSSDLTAPQPPRVDRSIAEEIASGAAGVRSLRGDTTSGLVVLPSTDSLAWRVLIPAARPLGDFEVLVDARSGSVVRVRNLLQFVTGSAKLYDPNPVAEQGSDSGLSDGGDADSPLLTSLRTNVALPHLDGGALVCLKGAYVDATVAASPVCRATPDWSDVTRSSDDFEALMAYYHIDRTQQYIQDLGFSNIDNRVQRALVDAIPDDNSFYSPQTKTITYGFGGVDDAEDADVIIHEYGHSIQDDQDPGFGSGWQAGSIGEGWGDYLSATMTYQSTAVTLPDYDTSARCIFDWDGVSWGTATPSLGGLLCGRRANSDRKLPKAASVCQKEVHCVGQVWSSALLDLRAALGNDAGGRSVLDRVVLQSQEYYVDNEKFSDAANALLRADDHLYPAPNRPPGHGKHYKAIHAEMRDRAIL